MTTTPTPSPTDALERTRTVRAPRAKVWAALADSKAFGTWFKAAFDGPFVAGEEVSATILEPGYEGVRFSVGVVRIEPLVCLAFHWHPGAPAPDADPSSEPRTLVEITLADAPGGGTEVTVRESGFDALPPGRRAEAFRLNDSGWKAQLERIRAHVEA